MAHGKRSYNTEEKPIGIETTVKRNPKYPVNANNSLIPVNTQQITSPVTLTTNLQKISEALTPFYYFNRSDLSNVEKQSILEYQSDSSKINEYLRGKYNPSENEKIVLDQQIERISSSFAKENSKVPEDVNVFKGIDFDFAHILLKRGGIEDRAFLSTSFNLNDAITYAKDANNNSSTHDGYLNLVAISLKKETKSLYLKVDGEILLDKNSHWKVTDLKEFESLTNKTESNGFVENSKYDKVRIIFITREEGDLNE